jgi:hypothetical protein
VAGAVRGRALARRRLGDDVRDLAAKRSLADALAHLSASSYGHRMRADLDVAGAQRAIAETALWHLRVLAGWLPPRGVRVARALAGWFELANLESHAVVLAVGERWREEPYALGALSTVWPTAAATATLPQLRASLAHSEWGDPGGDSLGAILLGVRIAWTRRLRTIQRQANEWADGGLALAVAKALFAGAGSAAAVTPPRVPELGSKWRDASDLAELAQRLPASARWVLRDVREPQDLWTAERTWWLRIDRDAARLLGQGRLGRTTVVGAATLLLTDCWRTRAALEEAARGSVPVEAADAPA